METSTVLGVLYLLLLLFASITTPLYVHFYCAFAPICAQETHQDDNR